ncbi:MAG TPA: hypothetical protein VHS78_11465 [Candidatus Elarobacter sp.]|jgi:hypothetical protein|nr:hypothetical protein [Candidatus Elarobacter sp.]
MSFDFSAKGRSARATIAVPEVPLNAIRARSRAARAHERTMRIAAVCTALVVVALGAGTGAGAKLYSTVRVWVSGEKASITVSSFDGVREPTSAEFHDAIAHATFPVVLPVGLPPGTHVTHVFSTPARHPSALVISYVNDRTGLKASFVLVDPKVVQLGGTLLRMQSASPRDVYDWRAGGELVLLPKTVPAAEADRLKAAMQTATPDGTLRATEPMLATISALGGPNRLELAERYAPRNGRSALIDRNQTRSVAALAAQGRPFLDMRVFHVTDVPYVNGAPDYARAHGWNARTVAIPPGGVRAIAAVLRSARGAGGDCACEVLFNQPNAAAYRIWTIPLSPSADVKAYEVDARTLAVVSRSR